MKELEQEIEEASIGIKDKEDKINPEIETLGVKIIIYTRWAWGFVILGAIITVFGVTMYLSFDKGKEVYGLNLLGDFMAGTVASTWSLAGLFFIYVAFLGQKQQLLNQQLEIMYSQIEVKYTRLELHGQKEEMKVQNRTLKKQSFENSFFNMIETFHSIVNAIDIAKKKSLGRRYLKVDDEEESLINGRDCFAYLAEKFHISPSNEPNIARSLLLYTELHNAHSSDLGHYFRTLYRILKFIDYSDVEDKKYYVGFLRAQLSSGELILLFYNCLSEFGSEKHKPLLEKYKMLKNLPEGSVPKAFRQEYANSAFE